MFVVRADSPYKTIRDLTGHPVAFGARGSGLPILSRFVLDGLGLKQDEDFQSVYLDRAGDGPSMVLDGRVAALWGAGIGWPGFRAVADSPGGARFIAPDAAEIARIRAKHSYLKPLTVPAGSYPNQNLPIDWWVHGALFWHARICRMMSRTGWRERCMASKRRSARDCRRLARPRRRTRSRRRLMWRSFIAAC